jgi:hypothetical protein
MNCICIVHLSTAQRYSQPLSPLYLWGLWGPHEILEVLLTSPTIACTYYTYAPSLPFCSSVSFSTCLLTTAFPSCSSFSLRRNSLTMKHNFIINTSVDPFRSPQTQCRMSVVNASGCGDVFELHHAQPISKNSNAFDT